MTVTSFYQTPSFKPEKGTVTKIIDRLIDEGIGVNSIDSTGQTPLHYAVRTGNLEAVQKLCQKGGNPNHQAKWQNLTPLQIASVIGDKEIIIELLKSGGKSDLKQSLGENSHDLYKTFHNNDLPQIP
jgi:ankyrin repeat protein